MQNIAGVLHWFAGFNLSVPVLCFSAGVVLLSATMRGLTGFGFGIGAVPLLSLFLSPKLAVAVSTLLQLVFAFTDAPSAWAKAHTPPLPALVTGALVGTPFGMLLLRFLPRELDMMAIAFVAVAAFGVTLRAKRSHNARVSAHPGPVGFVAGLLNGLASMPGPPVVVYFLNAPISPVAARASLIVFFAATAGFATVTGIIVGIVNLHAAALALVCLPALLLGNFFGSTLFHVGDVRLYRAGGLIILAAGAGSAVLKGLSGIFLK